MDKQVLSTALRAIVEKHVRQAAELVKPPSIENKIDVKPTPFEITNEIQPTVMPAPEVTINIDMAPVANAINELGDALTKAFALLLQVEQAKSTKKTVTVVERNSDGSMKRAEVRDA